MTLKNIYLLLFILILLFSFFIPFISVSSFHQYQYIGSGDFLSPISKDSIFFSNLFAYNPFLYGGSNTGFLISKFFPESLLFILLGHFGLNPSTIALIYISIIILISEVSTFYFLNYVFTYKFNITSDRKYFFSIIGSILYTFSLNFVATIIPGHFPQLIVYGLLPMMLVIFDKNVLSNKFQFNVFFKYFIIFLICSSAFGNIAFIYILLLTFGALSVFKILLAEASLKNIVINFFTLCSALITANIYWILSFVNSFRQLTNLSSETLHSLDNQVLISSTKSTILNLFLGRAEWQLYLLNSSFYISSITLAVFVFISIFFVLAIIRNNRNKFVLSSLAMSLFAIFISKGSREPFSSMFMWLYHNLFGFQVFRRPISKYHAVFLLFYFTLSIVGVAVTTIKLKTIKFILFVNIPISLITLYLIIIFIKTFQLTPFNIPNYYFDARDYLIKERVKQLLILPGLHGLQPTYDKSINNLYATDFLYSIWYFPFDTAVDADFATAYHKRIINPIMNKLRKGADICDLTKKAGISHIMLRHDLSADNPIEDMPNTLSKIFDKYKLFKEKKNFYSANGRGFTIYKIDERCTSNMFQISSSNAVKIDYQLINPVKIKVSISDLKNLSTLKYLNNFRSTWKIYISKYNKDFFLRNEKINVNTYPTRKVFYEGDELGYFLKKAIFGDTQKTDNGWTNRWSIDPEYIKRNYSHSYYQRNSDGSINVQLTIYFNEQNYLYLGIFIFGIILLGLFLYFGLLKYKEISQKPKE